LQKDIERWNLKFSGREINESPRADALLVDNAWLPKSGTVLDIAAGSGQNAVYLATRGYQVTAVDGSSEGLSLARQLAARCGVNIITEQMDLDENHPAGSFDMVIVFHYLNRPLYRRLPDLLKPGGILIAKTFNLDFARQKPGFNPDYVLADNELPALFSDLEILEHAESPEGSVGKSHIVARKSTDLQ